jgi:thiamine-phosphate pyrophosphorylase
VAGRTKADGVHVGSGLGDLRTTIQSFHPHRIVGAGALYSRHTAMEAGELEPDYVFFGRPHGDTHPEAHRKNLDLAEWWSELMEIPAVVMAGSSLDSIEDARTTGAAFVGLHDAVWKHPGGPAEAVQIALQRLGQMERAA